MMTKSKVDHLQGTVLSFFVKATDCGSPAKHSLVSAFIHVVPPDAFVPSFSQPQYSFTIPEDTAVGAALGSVYMGPGQTGFFTAVGGETVDSNQGGTFLVERESGLIRLTKPLDYEEVSIFRFKVAATTRRDLIEAVTTVDLEVKVSCGPLYLHLHLSLLCSFLSAWEFNKINSVICFSADSGCK